MQPDRLSDEQLDELAAELAPRLSTGTHGDRVILPRRQFVAAVGGTLGAGALMALGVDEATAQAAGSVGTAQDPVDVNAWDLDVANEVTSDVDFGGNDVTGVGSVSADDLAITQSTNISRSSRTIASGEISAGDVTFVSLDGEGGDDDDLDMITGGTDGDIIILRRGNATITVRHNIGSGGDRIFLDGQTDKILDDATDKLMLIKDNVWCELSSSNNL